MNFIRSTLVCSFLIVAALSGAVAQTPDDFAILKKVKDAAIAAPASRLTSTVTDRDSGAVLETTVLERVPPAEIHVVSTRAGRTNSEMISDGQRSLRRSGPNEPWKALPLNLSEMMNSMQSNLSEEYLRKEHGHLKLTGDDQIEGTAAKVYELTQDEGPSKIWIAADTSRILKVERDYDGPGPIAPPKFDGDLKSLHAQLKAATTKRHLHSVSTYRYDPSIKIAMPANQ